MRVVDVHRHRLQIAETPPHLLQEMIVLIEQTEDLTAVCGELLLRFAIGARVLVRDQVAARMLLLLQQVGVDEIGLDRVRIRFQRCLELVGVRLLHRKQDRRNCPARSSIAA
jgi:hypothetical protein